ncbi:hypothetical protein [Lentzea albida]|uniref:hypothetical protein n=1 Tax=Lentzea albida TaxID=65499 RepID=UPI000B7E4432|nr:hypothetical protein [Lentzea albida]
MRTRLLAALLTGSAVLTACGSDADKPITDAQRQWVDAVCGGVAPGAKAGAELRKQDPADPAAVKTAYVGLVTSNATAFADAEKKLKDLGAPESDLDGVHERFVKFVEESAKSYEAAQAPVQALAPDAQFWENAEKVLADTNVVTTPEDLRATFQELEKRPKYADALGRSQTCDGLRGTGL